MDVLWESDDPVSVRAVLGKLNDRQHRELAYTTALTVLDTLHNRGLVIRELQGRAYIYAAAVTRGEYAAERIALAADQADDKIGALMRFVDRLSPDEVAVLRSALDEHSARTLASPVEAESEQ